MTIKFITHLLPLISGQHRASLRVIKPLRSKIIPRSPDLSQFPSVGTSEHSKFSNLFDLTTVSPDNTQLLAVTQKFNAGNVNNETLSKTLSQSETHTPQKEKYSPQTQALKKINATLDENKPETLTAGKKKALADFFKKQEQDQVLSTANLPALFAEPK